MIGALPLVFMPKRQAFSRCVGASIEGEDDRQVPRGLPTSRACHRGCSSRRYPGREYERAERQADAAVTARGYAPGGAAGRYA